MVSLFLLKSLQKFGLDYSQHFSYNSIQELNLTRV